ncbi:MAG: (2Fe-2S) ferredoxin domain-containing protein [Thermoanaerobaculia bacterium]|nr:(2Fe-2S) ferredoxin domain-containing protein [Thermoanaerobaculia bacterium]
MPTAHTGLLRCRSEDRPLPKPDIQIFVCLKTRPDDSPKACCGKRGAEALYYRLKDLVRAQGLRDRVLVTKTGCQHHCSRGPTVSVWPQNHWYGHVGPEDAAELLEAALAGVEVDRLRMPPGPWE